MPTAPIGFDPSWASTTVFPYTLGMVVEGGGGKLYRCVQVVTAACADGAVMCVYDATGTTTTLPSGKVIGANRTTALTGTPAALIVVGIGVGAIAINGFGFVQVGGVHSNVLSGSSTLGRWQKAVTTNDTCGDATSSIAYTEAVFGMALTSTSGGRCQVQLRGLV